VNNDFLTNFSMPNTHTHIQDIRGVVHSQARNRIAEIRCGKVESEANVIL
jgi:hypothetical protein